MSSMQEKNLEIAELRQEIIRFRHDFNRQTDITNKQISELTEKINRLDVKTAKIEVYLENQEKRMSMLEKLSITSLITAAGGLGNSILNIIKVM
jgi:predicted RNase H-like nuclease (RuvC/YqgF family)